MVFRAVFWDVLYFTRQYNPEDSSEHNIAVVIEFILRLIQICFMLFIWGCITRLLGSRF
jgi:hypothetical protein